ncbi:MAG: DNA-directed RNA polymerase subunit omega [Prolixibacteraceae bacterium]|jgi:DNA-directed RNA polymerase subunit K/omega|nr:DNA-directed RNA polymerase subunit omega [Prolixibacteraceae bacterium]
MVDYKKTKAAHTTVARDLELLGNKTGNIYESIAIISKRANQVGAELKDELNQKLQEFASVTDNLEEVFENREQIEISKYYERLPKANLIAYQEFLDDEVYYRNPAKESKEA